MFRVRLLAKGVKLARRFILALIAATVVAPLPAAAQDRTETALRIVPLSAKPDLVTGGDVLLRLDGASAGSLPSLTVLVNGSNVTVRFKADAQGAALGLIDGLKLGANTVDVRTGRNTVARLVIDNHPIEGPIISGPHEKPFICETSTFKLQGGGTLGSPIDAECSVTRRVDYLYRAAPDGPLKPLPNPSSKPADVAVVTTLTGAEVPYIVRIETGTINRAIYQIAMLQDPSRDTGPDPWTRPSGWNGRLVYAFGGGCINGWYRQGATTGGVDEDWILRQGYAVASSTLNVFGNNCNDLLAAETMMMVKERFVEGYGPPLYTIGWGCSGGSYQSHQIADNYPGLLDGIVPACSFTDAVSGAIPMYADARLLDNYFRQNGTTPFTDEQKRAVAGFLRVGTIAASTYQAGRIVPTVFCPDALPVALRYDAVKNPRGARCDVYDHTVNIYGRDKAGFARRPLDNVGIQYGLKALNDGAISSAQFLELNERIGGYDIDGHFVPARMVADRAALALAYETGRVTNGGGGLASVPIIDLRGYADDAPNGDVHVRYYSFAMRERLRKANGRTDNHVMLVTDSRFGLFGSKNPVVQDALRQMDQWLDNLSKDTSTDKTIDKVVRAKPADLVDACWSRDERAERIAEPMVRGGVNKCETLYPAAAFPREIAGASVATDIIKCQLKPIDPADYKVTFSDAETIRLKRIFSDGVCDWSKPGVGQTAPRGTWLRFGAQNGGAATSRQ